MSKIDQFAEWHLTPLPIPPRSTLYALEPIGVGTVLVESLSSYITRLAAAHSIFSGLLMSKLIVPLVPGYSPAEKQHGLFRESGQRSTLLNGTGLPGKYAVQALATLTLRSDLCSLTLLPLEAIFPARTKGLLRLTKAWCPLCYEGQRLAEHPIYDPLLWFFQEVVLCPEHHCLLSTVCPYPDCGQSLPGVSWRSRAGYCSYCQRWLGISQEPVNVVPSRASKERQWQQWVALTVGELLAQVSSSVPPERQRVHQVVRLAIQQLTKGNVAAFAQALGICRNTVDWWYQGKRIPEMPKLLWLCQRIGLSLCEFLFGEITALACHFQGALLPGSLSWLPRTIVHAEPIYQALEQILADNEQPPPTLRQVAQRLKLNYGTLYKTHRTACYEIAARYRAYLRQQKEARLQLLCEEVKHVALQLWTAGITPTQKRIAPHLPQPGILRNPDVRAYLTTICSDIEQES